MSLKPTQRLKKRYVKFKATGELTEEELSRGIYKYSLNFFGEYGLSKRTIKLLEFANKEGILLVDRSGTEEVLGMLALIKELNNKPVRISPIQTSGTICSLKCKEKD